MRPGDLLFSLLIPQWEAPLFRCFVMTAAAPVAAKSKSWKRTLLLVGLVPFVGGLAWTTDAWLFTRLRVIASDTFANGNPEHPQLLLDGSDELKTYPPTRLVKFLRLPSAQIRMIVCLSLAERFDDKDPALWADIVPKLIDAHINDGNPVVRQTARTALMNLPLIPAADEEVVWKFVESPRPNDEELRDLRTRLLAILNQSNAKQLPRIIAYYKGWSESKSEATRREGLNQLLLLAPEAPEAYAAYRKFIDTGWIETTPGTEMMMRHHPELIDEFIDGNPEQRKFVLGIAAREVRIITVELQQFTTSRSTPRPPTNPTLLNEQHLQRIETIAADLLRADTSGGDVVKAFELLQWRANGGELLLNGARRMRGGGRASTIRVLTTWAKRNPKSAPKYVDDLLLWLRDDDRDVQSAVITFVTGSMTSLAIDNDWLPTQRTGADSPIVAACRRFMDEFPDRADYRCFAVLLQSGPTLREDDVDRLARAADRNISQLADYSLKEKRLFSSLAADLFQGWLVRFPEHKSRPVVKRFLDHRTDLEAKQLLSPPIRGL
jgi:hypothetical protein